MVGDKIVNENHLSRPKKKATFEKFGLVFPRRSKSNDISERKMTTPFLSTKYDEELVLQKKLGISTEEKERNNALRKLGVTNDDANIAGYLMKEVRLSDCSRKEEKLLGYSKGQLEREKALQKLGTTEEEIIEIRAKKLSTLGVTTTNDYYRTSISPPKTSLNDLVSGLKKSIASNEEEKPSFAELEYELYTTKKHIEDLSNYCQNLELKLKQYENQNVQENSVVIQSSSTNNF